MLVGYSWGGGLGRKQSHERACGRSFSALCRCACPVPVCCHSRMRVLTIPVEPAQDLGRFLDAFVRGKMCTMVCGMLYASAALWNADVVCVYLSP